MSKTLLAPRNKKLNKLNAQRDTATAKRLRLHKQKTIRNKKGALLKNQPKSLLVGKDTGSSAKIQPDRRWFGNTRVISQNSLDEFKEAMDLQAHDPFKIVLKKRKLPLSLLQEPKKQKNSKILETETFEQTFGSKSTRKRPKLSFENMTDLAKAVRKSHSDTRSDNDDDFAQISESARESIFSKGQSKRIWSELYKVIDSSDVVLQVLDARNPVGTRSEHIEKIFRKKDCHKNMVFVLNKCDLIPNWAVRQWLRILSKDFPAIAFHASIKRPFGKGSLIKLLRQYSKLNSHRKQISVGLVGYPNVGKSSIINALKKKKVCKVAPIAGETKVWQYVTLFKQIYLVDCPGVVCPNSDSDAEIVLKGVVRVENVENPEQYIPEILKRVKKEFLERAYGEFEWVDPEQFLAEFAKKSGKLLKGGEPDVNNCARMILHDWQRGRLSWFVPPPNEETEMEN
ncbi:Nucleolar GTP-binding protein 2 [Bonamia ostreae]|uniref:Nucleolar GTP-binding protein 2 n=1 Tax=Bonamia ostreae TaxID=126728 RepID=A0ABV2AID0_9EUKA